MRGSSCPAAGLTEKDVKAEYLKPDQAAERMRDGGARRIFLRRRLSDQRDHGACATGGGIELVPLAGPEADAIGKQYSFFAKDEIPAGTYKDVAAVKTLSVGAQWVTSAKLPDAVVYEIDQGLWSDKTRAALDAGHAKGKLIRKETRTRGRRHPAACGRREILQGSRPVQKADP